MKQRVVVLALLAVFIAVPYGRALAQRPGQRVFVSDALVITLRTGPSTQNAIVRNLPAGTPLEVLELQADSGYARVREMGRDSEGWVLTQYLTPDPIARDRLATAEANLAAARERVAELQQQLEQATQDLNATRQQLENTESQEATVSAELAAIRTASASAIELRDQNETLRRRLNEREATIDELNRQNAELNAGTRQDWFLIGSGVLFAGIVLGLVLPSLKRRKRGGW